MKLASTENPLGPSPRAIEAIKAALPELDTAALYTARPINALRVAQDAGAGSLQPDWFSTNSSSLVR